MGVVGLPGWAAFGGGAPDEHMASVHDYLQHCNGIRYDFGTTSESESESENYILLFIRVIVETKKSKSMTYVDF